MLPGTSEGLRWFYAIRYSTLCVYTAKHLSAIISLTLNRDVSLRLSAGEGIWLTLSLKL